MPPEDLAELDPLDLYGAALAHWSFARQRDPGTAKVRVYNPEFEQHGWQSAHTVVELVSDDMPFLVDSTTMELSGHGAGIHLLIHPVIRVRRDGDGELAAVLAADAPDEEGTLAESFIHVEIDRAQRRGRAGAPPRAAARRPARGRRPPSRTGRRCAAAPPT